MKPLIVIGTRPEAIKLLPLCLALEKKKIPYALCSTGQHQDLLGPLFSLFGINPEYTFQVMQQGQSLSLLAQKIICCLNDLLSAHRFSAVIVQGDTISAFCAGLTAFFSKVPVVHIEAGLRTYVFDLPFPEEMIRRCVTAMSSYHCAPTFAARRFLIQEGVLAHQIFVTGNTGIDALLWMKKQLEEKKVPPSLQVTEVLEKAKERAVVLCTIHRRENFEHLEKIFRAIKKFALSPPYPFIVYISHPHVKNIHEMCGDEITFLPPLSYQDMVYFLGRADLIITDSGGLQEEAATLGKKIVCMRSVTERHEGALAGYSLLASGDEASIVEACKKQLAAPPLPPCTLYGDGNASFRIIHQLPFIFGNHS